MDTLPKHVAIIMDGNGRWAKKQNRPRVYGHKVGAEVAKVIVKACVKRGIQVLTLFAFSSENWNRPVAEVGFLMDLFLYYLEDSAKELHQHNIQCRIIGDISALNEPLRSKIQEVQHLTVNNTGLKLVIAINYSGRWDLLQVIRRLARQVESKKIAAAEIKAESIDRLLCLGDLPDPDLLIRTSGEKRVSNFMLWQIAYTELFFTSVLWPDFTPDNLEEALACFASRRRRFGRVVE